MRTSRLHPPYAFRVFFHRASAARFAISRRLLGDSDAARNRASAAAASFFFAMAGILEMVPPG